MEYRATASPVELRYSGNGSSGEPTAFEGVAAVFYRPGTPGSQYELGKGVVERVGRDAFRDVAQNDIRALFNHDPTWLLGRTASRSARVWVDDVGLRYSVPYDPLDHHHRTLARMLQRGDISGSSFSFRSERDRWLKHDGLAVRELLRLTVFDVSLATYPAYTATTVTVKNGDSSGGRSASDEAELAYYRARLRLRELKA